MKRFYLMTCFIFLLFISATAQSQENWQTFAPNEEEFSVEVPAELISIPIDDGASEDEKNRNRRYKNLVGGTYFFVFSDAPESPLLTNGALDFARHFKALGEPFRNADLTGEKFKFEERPNFHHTIWIVKTQKRSYVFQASGDPENNPQMERFFAGIKINGRPLTPNKIAQNSNDKKNVSNNSNGVGTGTGTGRGVGTGSGKGVGTGSGNGGGEGTGAPIQRPVVTPLVITSKPRIQGTNFAHLYKISGLVRLRVTFLADGTIGNVSPVTGLPFAITAQAMEAAKLIKFEPEKRDGQPATVTRMLEYNF